MKGSRKSCIVDGRTQWALSSLPGHHLGGIIVKCSFCCWYWHPVKSRFDTVVCAESQQVQDLGNCFVPTFEYFSSWASWLRCASWLAMVFSTQERLTTQRDLNWLLHQILTACLKFSFYSYEAISFCGTFLQKVLFQAVPRPGPEIMSADVMEGRQALYLALVAPHHLVPHPDCQAQRSTYLLCEQGK